MGGLPLWEHGDDDGNDDDDDDDDDDNDDNDDDGEGETVAPKMSPMALRSCVSIGRSPPSQPDLHILHTLNVCICICIVFCICVCLSACVSWVSSGVPEIST